MKKKIQKLSVFKISLLFSILYCIVGNVLGMLVYREYLNEENILVILFLPYTVLWGWGKMAGLDTSLIVIELFMVHILSWVFLPIGLLISKKQ